MPVLPPLGKSRLSLTYEFRDRWRLPPHLQAREAAADEWAIQFVEQRLAPASGGTSPFRPPTLQALRNLRIPRGFLRACLERLRAAVAAASPDLVQQLQRQAAAHQVPTTPCPVASTAKRPRRPAALARGGDRRP